MGGKKDVSGKAINRRGEGRLTNIQVRIREHEKNATNQALKKKDIGVINWDNQRFGPANLAN